MKCATIRFRSMDELMLEPDPEKHSLHNNTGEEDASELFTFSEVKTGLAVIKLEPEGERDPELDGTIDPEPDDEIDPLALNSEGGEPIVEREDLLCPLAFLAVESKAVDGMWDSTAVSMKVEVDGETRGEEYEVHLEELNGVRYNAWSECMKVKDPERWACETERTDIVRRIRRRRGRPPIYKTKAELEKRRERNKLRQRRYRASKTPEELERGRERDRLRKREYRAAQTEAELGRQRERDRLRKREYRASLSAEELEQQRMRDMLCKRRCRASKRLEIESFVQCYGHIYQK